MSVNVYSIVITSVRNKPQTRDDIDLYKTLHNGVIETHKENIIMLTLNHVLKNDNHIKVAQLPL